MNDTKDYWKIFNSDKSVMILTDCPNTFKGGDGVYFLMKCLQKIYGQDLCSMQKFDERFDKIEDFDIILEAAYNIDGNRLIGANLFEYDKAKNELKIDLGKPRKIELDFEFTYKIMKTRILAIHGWDGLRKFIVGTMGRSSCWTTWGRSMFGKDLLEKYFKEDTK